MSQPDADRSAPGDWPDANGPGQANRQEIEIVGPHLRVSGRIALGRFSRLSDLINHNRGYITLVGARLLARNGTPTPLVVGELIVNPDEVAFIGHSGEPAAEVATGQAAAVTDVWGRPAAAPGEALLFGDDRPSAPLAPSAPDRQLRHFVIFTPGHTITGTMHVYREMTLANFVEATDPRFLPMSDAVARSLADRRVISHFKHLLVNRTHINAMAESDRGSEIAEAAVQDAG